MARQVREPLWRKIADSIEADISSGRLEPGERLPPETVLAERFAVSRYTVRQAVAHLERQNLVDIQHGRGLFVAVRPIPFLLDSRTRFSENLKRLGLRGERRFLHGYRDAPSDEVAAALTLAPHEEVAVVHGIGIVEGRSVSLVEDYYSATRFPGIEERLRTNPSRTAVLAGYGVVDYTRRSTRISSRLPTGQEAVLLGIARTRPLIESTKIDVDMTGVPIAFGRASFCADRVQFIIE